MAWLGQQVRKIHRILSAEGRATGCNGSGTERRIGVSFSADAVHWTPIKPVLEADEHDPPGTEFYWLHAMRYEDVYLGLLSVLHMDNNLLDFRQPDPVGREQTVDMELVVSRDGVHWQRTKIEKRGYLWAVIKAGTI